MELFDSTGHCTTQTAEMIVAPDHSNDRIFSLIKTKEKPNGFLKKLFFSDLSDPSDRSFAEVLLHAFFYRKRAFLHESEIVFFIKKYTSKIVSNFWDALQFAAAFFVICYCDNCL